MFKKTLLALSVATIASTATAGTIYSSTTDGTIALLTNTPLAAEALGADGALLGGDDNCDVLATDLGLTLTNTGNGEGGSNDAITDASAATDTFTTGSVAMTGAGTCTVVFPTQTSATAISSSIEAAQTVDVEVDATLVSGIGGYDVGDTITITITGASIDKAATELLVPTLVDQAGTATAAVLDVEAGAVRFTVATANSAPSSIFTLANVVLDATGVSTDTEVSYSAFATNTSGTDFDVTGAAVVADLVPQYSAEIDIELDGVIDVSEDRLSLSDEGADDTAGAGENVDEDTFTITISEDATGTTLVEDETVYTFGGDFTWLMTNADADEDGDLTSAEIITAVTYSTTSANIDTVVYSLNDDMDELTATTTLVTQLDLENTFVFSVAGGTAVLNETDYTVSVIVNDDGASSTDPVPMTALTSTSAGSWTLNGSVVTVPYMPFDSNTAVIMRHTNTGVQTGDMTVRYMLEGVSTAWETAGVIGSSSRGVQNIRDLVMDAIMADAGVTSGKVAIEITTNVPAADVTVYAAYKVKDEQDRGFVGTFGQHGSAL